MNTEQMKVGGRYETWIDPRINRNSWEAGVWDDEPDKIIWRDSTTRYICMVKRSHHGVWCGYVGVDPTHKLHGKSYQDIDEDSLDVHGGLTFSEACHHGPMESTICHVPDPGEPDNVWWFGFDCGHGYDYSPGTKSIFESHDFDVITGMGEVYRDLEYVTNETVKLAKQLKELES